MIDGIFYKRNNISRQDNSIFLKEFSDKQEVNDPILCMIHFYDSFNLLNKEWENDRDFLSWESFILDLAKMDYIIRDFTTSEFAIYFLIDTKAKYYEKFAHMHEIYSLMEIIPYRIGCLVHSNESQIRYFEERDKDLRNRMRLYSNQVKGIVRAPKKLSRYTISYILEQIKFNKEIERQIVSGKLQLNYEKVKHSYTNPKVIKMNMVNGEFH